MELQKKEMKESLKMELNIKKKKISIVSNKDGGITYDNGFKDLTIEKMVYNIYKFKFNDFVNNNPDYFNYLKDKVEGNITTTSLSEDEIAEIKEQEEMEEEALDKFKEELNEVLETE